MPVEPTSPTEWYSEGLLTVGPEVRTALAEGTPVVALESTLIAHGLPWPINLQTAQQAESAVRACGAVPATVGIWAGQPGVGLSAEQLHTFASAQGIRKASRRDLAAAIVQGAHAATTVSATMVLAHRAGVRVFATGGIGGVHPPWHTESPGPLVQDVSADLYELARTPVAVVCAGAKSILDLPATLELLESLGVPVLGYQTDTFPAFYLACSGQPVSARIDTPEEAARLLRAHWQLGGGGVVLAQPLPADEALNPDTFAQALQQAEADARTARAQGPQRTPFVLARLAELTQGATLQANQKLILANARLAAKVAGAFERSQGNGRSES